MKVELSYFCPDDERILNLIARQSRKLHPGPEDMENCDLLADTINWEHNEIQRFSFYVFHVVGLSRAALQQLSRYHFIALNVSSGRHTCSWVVKNPSDDEEFGEYMLQLMDNIDVRFSHLPLEQRRYAYPSGLTVNLFMGMNGQELRHFLKQRLDKHAQEEIRLLANKVYDLVFEVHPHMLANLK